MANSVYEIKKHIEKEIKVRQEKSQEVCYHYRNGFGFKGEKSDNVSTRNTM